MPEIRVVVHCTRCELSMNLLLEEYHRRTENKMIIPCECGHGVYKATVVCPRCMGVGIKPDACSIIPDKTTRFTGDDCFKCLGKGYIFKEPEV